MSAETAGGGAALPPGWAALTNPDGKVYYEHAASGAIQWEPPTQGGGSGGSGGGRPRSGSRAGSAPARPAGSRGGAPRGGGAPKR